MCVLMCAYVCMCMRLCVYLHKLYPDEAKPHIRNERETPSSFLVTVHTVIPESRDFARGEKKDPRILQKFLGMFLE